MKKISVVIPVYKGESVFNTTVQQIRRSTWKNIEILLINDGSPDNSLDVCRSLANQDKRITVLTKKNSGVASTRNFGADYATGDYICFCDQDDYVEIGMYEKLIDALEDSNADLAVCGTGRMTDGKKSDYEVVRDGLLEGNDIQEKIITPFFLHGYRLSERSDYCNLHGTVWKVVIRKDFFDSRGFRFRKYINYEDDWIMFSELILSAESIVTVSDTLYYWVMNHGSETYRYHYIRGYYPKAVKLKQYIDSVMDGKRLPVKFREKFSDVFWMDQTILFVENEISETGGGYLRSRARIEEFCRRRHISDKKYLAGKTDTGFYYKKLMILLLTHKMYMCALLTAKLFRELNRILISSDFLMRIERMTKKIY